MSLLSLGGFNLLVYWASTGANIWEDISTRIGIVREIAHKWIQNSAKNTEKIQQVLQEVDDLQQCSPTVISQIKKTDLLEIIDKCESPVRMISELVSSAESCSHGQLFINNSLTIVEDVLTLCEEIIQRLPGENQNTAAQYTKKIDDCLLDIIPF